MTILITVELQKSDMVKRESEWKDNLSIQYKPVLQMEEAEIVLGCHQFPDRQYDVDEDGEMVITGEEWFLQYYFSLKIKLKNIGRGEIMEGNISCQGTDFPYALFSNQGLKKTTFFIFTAI